MCCYPGPPRPPIRLLLVLAAAIAAVDAVDQVAAAEPRFASSGVLLRGSQFRYDCGFELRDWNGDGRLDLFLPNTALMSFVVYQNDGTPAEPRFRHAVPYPVNLTETEPQTLEHSQSWTSCDLNGDGLFDLILFDGQLRMVYNTGTPHAPDHWHLAKLPQAKQPQAKQPQFFPGSEAMIRENARHSTGPESMFWNKGIFARQVLTMTVADWDRDGLDDLLVCRFKDEAPGVTPTGGAEQWTSWGRALITRPTQPPPPADAPQFLEPLAQAPERGLYFYRNVGTRTEPWFDEGVEIRTPDGQSLAAPNPVAADIDGDGALDLLSTECAYSCNAFRVDWPTAPAVTWFHRPNAEDVAVLEAGRPLTDADGRPIPAGTQARLADFRGTGAHDLFVMDAGLKGTIRWYRNRTAGRTVGTAAPPQFEPPVILRGEDFLRFDFMCQPLIVDWFGPGSRDLILHGNTDAHCKWSLRRTALYRNTAPQAGAPRYEPVGWFTYRGDPAMVPPSREDRPYDVYGSAVWLVPDTGDDTGDGRKRLLMSVAGRLYLFSNLAADGLTFQDRKELKLPAERNRRRGWQEIDVDVPEKVRYIRIDNDRNGMGNLRDSFLHLVRFEALSGGRNVATPADGVTVADQNDEPSPHYRVQRPERMFDPENEPSDTEPHFTSFGYYIGPAVVTLKEPVRLEKIRFLLSDREARWYDFRLPFYWQGKLYRQGTEQGEPWYQYTVEVSSDKENWTTVADTMPTEMMRSFPCAFDWNDDGRFDVVLGVLGGRGIWPARKEYRLYLNTGTNDDPRFGPYASLCDENGKPLDLQAYWYNAYGLQCGAIARDLDVDGRRDLIVEGFRDSELVWFRNVSEGGQPAQDGQREFRFQRVAELGSPRPIRYPSRYTYFHVGDVDGDTVPDLLNSDGGVVSLFPGIAATAPAAVSNLTIVASDEGGVTLRWSRPAGASRYRVWWSDRPITALDRPETSEPSGVSGTYDGSVQTVTLGDLPPGEILKAVVTSFGERQETSALSNSVEAATWPLRASVLESAAACSPDAQNPGTATPQPAPALTARAPGAEKQKVTLLRFDELDELDDLPAAATLERAVLELTVADDPQQLAEPSTLAVSCLAVGGAWEPAAATWTDAAPGRPWKPEELDTGGRFLSTARPEWTVGSGRVLRWDVTPAVRKALQSGGAVNLLLRVANTGKYVAGAGYKFCGTGCAEAGHRPRLRLIHRESHP